MTVAGGNGVGAATNQLHHPNGLFVSDDGSIYVADTHNQRVMKWGPGVASGRVVAGNGITGSHSDLLNHVDSFIFMFRQTVITYLAALIVEHAIVERVADQRCR